jgi:hypothetical protein
MDRHGGVRVPNGDLEIRFVLGGGDAAGFVAISPGGEELSVGR